MRTVSLRWIFLGTGVPIAACLLVAVTSFCMLLLSVSDEASSTLSTFDYLYAGVAGIALVVAFGMSFRLYRIVTAAVRHDVLSLTRMFRDVRDGSLRENYPIALQEFAETLTYLRQSGRKLVREKERLKNLGLIDHLSQLANRRYFERRLSHLFDVNKMRGPSSVLLIDLDHFKSVNDQHGHDAGDLLIVNFAKALRSTVRQTDFLARLGGDEFCVIYPYTPIEKAIAFVERLRQQLPRIIPLLRGVDHPLRWTGGLSAIEETDDKFDDVLWRADKALIQAKEAGRNNTKIYSEQTVTKPRAQATTR